MTSYSQWILTHDLGDAVALLYQLSYEALIRSVGSGKLYFLYIPQLTTIMEACHSVRHDRKLSELWPAVPVKQTQVNHHSP